MGKANFIFFKEYVNRLIPPHRRGDGERAIKVLKGVN